MKIKREIDGKVYEFELTENELYAASVEADIKDIKDCVETELKYRKDLGMIRAEVYEGLASMVNDITEEIISNIYDNDVLEDIRWDIINSCINDRGAKILK